jgi:hypothetical protein
MKKVLIISFSLFILGACTKDITRFNEQTKRAESVPAETLFTNGLKNLNDLLASANVNVNVFRFTVQHWAATTYQDEPRYDFTTRAIPNGIWSRLYRNILANLNRSKQLMEADEQMDAAEKANKIAQVDMLQVYAYHLLTTTFGNVPYSAALDYDNVFPAYDDALTIYGDIIKRLQADVAALNSSANGISASQDLLYGGDVNAWKKFGNAMLMRMALIIADVDAAQAKTVFTTADAGAFTSAADNAEFKYLATTPNTNPIWVDLVQSGRQDMVAANTLLDKLKAMNDPRLTLYFRPNNNGDYIGGIVGSNNTFSTVAKPSDQITAPDFPNLILGYSEVEFMRAEAIERGYGNAGNAADHYKNAIIASILYWGGTSDEAAAYVARPDVAYATAAGNWKQKIGFQKWIALYNQPFQGWLEMRRLDQPVLPAPVEAKSGYPNRLTYPTSEQQLNPDNYSENAKAIGGDDVETKLFFDKQ